MTKEHQVEETRFKKYQWENEHCANCCFRVNGLCRKNPPQNFGHEVCYVEVEHNQKACGGWCER